MIRVLVERDGSLREGEAHHFQVRRVEPGEVVELRDGEGLIGNGTLLRAGKAWSVETGVTERMPAPPSLVLAVGAGDRDRFAWVVEKATELGVTAVIPMECERTVGVATKIRRSGSVPRLTVTTTRRPSSVTSGSKPQSGSCGVENTSRSSDWSVPRRW